MLGAPSGCHQNLVHMHHRAVGQRRGDPVGGRIQAFHSPVQRELMPRCGIGLAESVANVLVEAAQKLLAAMQERDLAAEAVEDAGELHRDIAAADHQDALRQGLRGGRPRST